MGIYSHVQIHLKDLKQDDNLLGMQLTSGETSDTRSGEAGERGGAGPTSQ
jgi:hypothetical protein